MSVNTLERPPRVKVPKIMPEYSRYHSSKRKRGLDIAVSNLSLPAWKPLLKWTQAQLKDLLDEGDPFYRQIREDGSEIIKLRTMFNTPETQTVYSRKNSRIPEGAEVFRDLRLDELPQMNQVRKGQMRAVSIRPIDPFYFPNYEEHLRKEGLFDLWSWSRSPRGPLKPGVTGPAQLATLSYVKLDRDFCVEWAQSEIKFAIEGDFLTDLKILAQTAVALGGKAIDHFRSSEGEVAKEALAS